MKIALVQSNPIVGDLVGNTDKMLKLIDIYEGKADLIVFPELSICGYPPLDLIEESSFMMQHDAQKLRIKQATDGKSIYVAFGHVSINGFEGNPFYNSLSIFHNGELFHAYHKHLLPTYGIFDEARHFEPGTSNEPVTIKGQKIGFLICEDLWNTAPKKLYHQTPAKSLIERGAKTIISINASPSNVGKMEQRLAVCKELVKNGVTVVYVNQVGANDDIVFDGNSFVMGPNGKLKFKLLGFLADHAIYDTETLREFSTQDFDMDEIELIYNNLVLGIRDYAHKSGFKTAVIGSSGGIDSAVTMALAVDALGPHNVTAITMPTQYSSAGSVDDSQELCDNLHIKLHHLPIKDVFGMVKKDFIDHICPPRIGIQASEPDTYGLEWENAQPRIRGLMLMTFSNRYGHLLLTTGNKSELSVGYCTLYGDMCGGLAVLGDVYKTEVFKLAEFINFRAGRTIIPLEIINKPPSAELAPGQQDSDSLPPYDMLDAILKQQLEWKHLTHEEQVETVAALRSFELEIGGEKMLVIEQKIANLVRRAEFKRRQAPPTLRCHGRAWGAGRRVPIVQKYSDI